MNDPPCHFGSSTVVPFTAPPFLCDIVFAQHRSCQWCLSCEQRSCGHSLPCSWCLNLHCIDPLAFIVCDALSPSIQFLSLPHHSLPALHVTLFALIFSYLALLSRGFFCWDIAFGGGLSFMPYAYFCCVWDLVVFLLCVGPCCNAKQLLFGRWGLHLMFKPGRVIP